MTTAIRPGRPASEGARAAPANNGSGGLSVSVVAGLFALFLGLPVITTAHTAGPDLIRDGVDGFIVPIRSSAAIAICLEQLHREPSRRAAMSEAARQRAAEFSWETYGATLAACVAQTLGNG